METGKEITNMNKKFRHYKAYALVTGAASGMGRLYVRRLAMMGYNVIMVDINADGLYQTDEIVKEDIAASRILAPSIKKRFNTVSIIQDLSLQDAADRIFEKTEGMGCEVEVLINNAGIMYCQGIAETSEHMIRLITMVHMITPLLLCRKYVNGMKERNCGYILNVSSLASWMIWPGIGMYGATKRFVKDYSRELRIECQRTGVSVTNAYFGAVDTPLVPLKDKWRKLARRFALMISPEKAVDLALKATFRRRRSVMPGVMNHLFRPLCVIMPDCLLGWIYRKAKPYLMEV